MYRWVWRDRRSLYSFKYCIHALCICVREDRPCRGSCLPFIFMRRRQLSCGFVRKAKLYTTDLIYWVSCCEFQMTKRMQSGIIDQLLNWMSITNLDLSVFCLQIQCKERFSSDSWVLFFPADIFSVVNCFENPYSKGCRLKVLSVPDKYRTHRRWLWFLRQPVITRPSNQRCHAVSSSVTTEDLCVLCAHLL